MLRFPQNFLWGAASSSHQVEGGNIHNDWWQWEQGASGRQKSGDACRHYRMFREDFDLAQSLGHNAHRFSIEWSRIEPEEGRTMDSEVGHYREVIRTLKERGIEPIVTLHHFTNPLWLAEKGGWLAPGAIESFLRYVRIIVEAYAEDVKYWVTVNEPMVYAHQSYVLGNWPPQEKSLRKGMKVAEVLRDAHIEAYRIIHALYKAKNLSSPMVTFAKNMRVFVPCNTALKNILSVYLKNFLFNFDFMGKAIKTKTLDFIGLNYYTRDLVEAGGWSPHRLLVDVCGKNHSTLEKNSLGWDIYPEGLLSLLLGLRKYNLPVCILENGICTPDDNRRWNFIYEHLKSVHAAIQKGVRVTGYMYWSLTDNFEWDKGFVPRFGLIDVDYKTCARTVRESARKFAAVCRANAFE
ncbi:MAG: glycoside hydrolase family 1 protein [Candidatus Omnitrophica bacterium]|nr:glycoside hydrolase family 1 protein [Candidatus Omnitrophota bacterium]